MRGRADAGKPSDHTPPAAGPAYAACGVAVATAFAGEPAAAAGDGEPAANSGNRASGRYRRG